MFVESNQYQHTGLKHFKDFLLQDKLKILQSEISLPFKYWQREKDNLTKIITDGINRLKKVLHKRVTEAGQLCELFCECDESIKQTDLAVMQEKWVYTMSYIMHDMHELNELRLALKQIQQCEYRSIGGENDE